MAIARHEDLGRLTGLGQGVERSAPRKEEGIARRPSARQDDSIDDVIEPPDPRPLDPHHERTRPRIARPTVDGLQQIVVLATHDDADDQRAQDVEAQQAVDEPLARLGDVPPRRLRLPGRQHDQLRAQDEGEPAPHQRRPEGQELARIPGRLVRLKRPWRILPIAKAQPIMLGSAPEEQHHPDHDQTQDAQDLDTREPELALAVPTHDEDVENHDRGQDDGDPHRLRDRVAPIPNHDVGRAHLGRHQHRIRVPIVPPGREGQARLHVPVHIERHAAPRERDVRRQLGQILHHHPDDGADDQEAQEERRGPDERERRPCAHE